MTRDILQSLIQTVVDGQNEKAAELTRSARQAGMSPDQILMEGLFKGLNAVSEKFSKLELFLTDMKLSADSVKASIKILSTARYI